MEENINNIIVKLMTYSEREFFNYLKKQEIKETEITKEISNIIALTELIKQRREVFELISENFFQEREKLSKMALDSLDLAISCGDEELADNILNFLNTIYQNKYIKLEI